MAVTVTVEDGTGVPDANAYVSVADFETYADQRGWSYTGKTEDQIGAAIIRATSSLDALYGNRFPGIRANGNEQGLAWPRKSGSYVNGDFVAVYPGYITDAEGALIEDDVVPIQIIRATSELAWRELLKPGATMPDVAAGGGFKRIKAGSVEIERFDSGSSKSSATFAAVDAILAGLLGPGIAASPYTALAIRI